MDSPFSDFKANETKNYYDHYNQVDELLAKSPFLDKQIPGESDFEEVNSYENENDGMRENFDPPSWIQAAVEGNQKERIALGWAKYQTEINELLQTNWIFPKPMNEKGFAFAVAAWQKKNGFTKFDSNGIIDTITWSLMRESMTPSRSSSLVCDLDIAIPDFAISQRQKINPRLLSAADNKKAIKWNEQYLKKISINPLHILTDLERYVDVGLVRLAIEVFNKDKTDIKDRIDMGTSSIDAVFVEAIHQFQRKIYFNKDKIYLNTDDKDNPTQIYGKVQYGTLHSLGIIDFVPPDKLDLRKNECATATLSPKKLNIKILINKKECNYKNWSDFTYNPSFLGLTFSTPVHYLLIRQLRIAEKHLRDSARFKGHNVVEMAAKLGLSKDSQEHKGGRRRKCSNGMHAFGLALDIDYKNNPWIGAGFLPDRESEKSRAFADDWGKLGSRSNREKKYPEAQHKKLYERYTMLDVLKKASGQKLYGDKISEYLHQVAKTKGLDTYSAFAELEKRNDEFKKYISSKSNESELSYWQNSATFEKHVTLNGFLNLDRDLVYALRHVAKLAWGAIDFGPGEAGTGDIMHFDMRTLGVGKLICDNTPPCSGPKSNHPSFIKDKSIENPQSVREDINAENSGEWNESEKWEDTKEYLYEDNENKSEENFYESENLSNELNENEWEDKEDFSENENYEDGSEIENEFDKSDYTARFLLPEIENFTVDPKYGKTYYLKIGVGSGLPANTGVFVPTSYKNSTNVDIVFFLHGHMGRKNKSTGEWIPDPGFQKSGINYYWHNYSNIREYFVQQSPDAILIAPTLGSISSTQFGTLAEEKAFERFISSCISELKKLKAVTVMAIPYRIILSAHSGGGNPMGKILAQNNGLNNKISEVWGFDCLYGSHTGNWVKNYHKWIKSSMQLRPQRYFLHCWATNGPSKNGQYLQQQHPGSVKNISPAINVSHQDIIKYAWINVINKTPLFDSFARSRAINSSTQTEENTLAYDNYGEANINTDELDEEAEELDFVDEEWEDGEDFFERGDNELFENLDSDLENQVSTPGGGMAAILYQGFDLQTGDDDRTGKYAGVISGHPGSKHVAQLQADLLTLGFGYAGPGSTGQFGTNTQLAVREFQIHAKMDYLSLQTQNVSRVYTDSLIQIKNTSIYAGLVSGVVNAATRSVIQIWLQNNWRCPVIIEAWNMLRGTRNTIEYNNLWKYDDLKNTGPRMFAVDFSNYYQNGSSRRLTDRQVLGDYSRYGTWGGPGSAPPTHCWAEAEIIPNASVFLSVNPALPVINQLTPSQLSTFRVVRAVSEVECNAFYDGLNAYDNVYMSIPPFHAVLGETIDRNGYGGELGGFISYFSEYFPTAFNRLFGICGIRATKKWNTNGRDLFKPSRRFTSVISIQNENGTFTPINKTNKDTYHWFRSWHWFYRFAMAGRTSAAYQQALWCYARTRLRGLLSTPWDNILKISYMQNGVLANRIATIGDVFTSEKAAAIILRWHVRFPAQIANNNVAGTVLRNAVARSGIRLASPLNITITDEQVLIDNMVAQITKTSFLSTITYVKDWPEWAPRTINPAGGHPNYRHFALDIAFCNALSTTRNANGFPLDTGNLPPSP